MIKKSKVLPNVLTLGMFLFSVCSGYSQSVKPQGYVLEHEQGLGVDQPGPHNGTGTTTGYSYFAKTPNLKLVFRKRVLHPGASIGYHLQGEDEIYYIVSGRGEMKMNDSIIPMKAGDAILTRPGSSHGLTQVGKEDLVIIISYEQKEKP